MNRTHPDSGITKEVGRSEQSQSSTRREKRCVDRGVSTLTARRHGAKTIWLDEHTLVVKSLIRGRAIDMRTRKSIMLAGPKGTIRSLIDDLESYFRGVFLAEAWKSR